MFPVKEYVFDFVFHKQRIKRRNKDADNHNSKPLSYIKTNSKFYHCLLSHITENVATRLIKQKCQIKTPHFSLHCLSRNKYAVHMLVSLSTLLHCIKLARMSHIWLQGWRISLFSWGSIMMLCLLASNSGATSAFVLLHLHKRSRTSVAVCCFGLLLRNDGFRCTGKIITEQSVALCQL